MNLARDRRAYALRATAGIALYLALALAPLALMLLSPPGPGREPLREFAVALGFGGVGVLGMQFAVSARLGRLKAPYGIDVVYRFHRSVSLAALGLVVTHPVLLFVVTPARVALLNVFTAPWAARFGVTTVLLVGVIVAISLWRKRFGLRYEVWRTWHDVFAFSILAFATSHVLLNGYYADGTKGVALLAYTAIWAGFLVYTRLGKPLRKLRRPYRLAELRQEAPDVWTLALEPEDHSGLTFRPGQFAWFTIGRSPFSIEEHPFSFSTSPPEKAGDGFEIAVKELGDFTATIGSTAVGSRVYVDGPHGAFSIDRYPADSYVFIAGGIGITPILSQLRTAALRGDRTPMTLVYGAGTKDDLVFAEEIDRLAATLDLRTIYVLEQPPDDWAGERGFITREIMEAAVGDSPAGHEYFLCGPPPMTDAVEGILADMGVDHRRLHYELFDLV